MKNTIKLIEFIKEEHHDTDSGNRRSTIILSSKKPIKLPVTVQKTRRLLFNTFGTIASDKMSRILFVPSYHKHKLVVAQEEKINEICEERGMNYLLITNNKTNI